MSKKLKVLVVDDELRMVKTICDILLFKGYEALPAYSGEEAVQMVKGNDFDCVLMDIKMPGIDGVKALKMIKGASPDTPVVLMSANATAEQVAEAKLHGAAAVLGKPIDFQPIFSFFSLLGKEEIVLIEDISRSNRNALQGEPFNCEVV